LPALVAAGLALAAPEISSSAPGTSQTPRSFARLAGEVVLENEHVLVEKFVLAPGQSTGPRTHPANQLLVFVKGGVLTADGSRRATLWRDGRVWWTAQGAAPDAGSTNTGTTRIEMVLVTLKAAAKQAGATAPAPTYCYLDYPNIPGEDLLDNDFVIVQRFTVNPNQWEGVHAHHPNMLYIFIKGGLWAERSRHSPEHQDPEAAPDGEVGWMPVIDVDEGHESGNVGKEPSDFIWVTLKQ
jgi:quercetin dioxygenase-like cupin family protein